MTYVAINVLSVADPGAGAVLESRFAGRAGMVENSPGFVSFELLRPVEGTGDYMVLTRWRERSDYEAWLASRSFQQGHAGGGAAEGRGPAAGGPAATGSQIWGFEVVQSTGVVG